MNEGMENLKTIETLEKKIWDLKKEIDRLKEELQLLEIIERDHKELNGKLHTEVAKLKIANKELEKKIMEFVRPIERTIDDL
jgi:chromosome segregation ATPase